MYGLGSQKIRERVCHFITITIIIIIIIIITIITVFRASHVFHNYLTAGYTYTLHDSFFLILLLKCPIRCALQHVLIADSFFFVIYWSISPFPLFCNTTFRNLRIFSFLPFLHTQKAVCLEIFSLPSKLTFVSCCHSYFYSLYPCPSRSYSRSSGRWLILHRSFSPSYICHVHNMLVPN